MKTIGNILWLLLGGLALAFGWLLWAVLLAITIIGIPFARQCLKLASFSLWPFGRVAVNDPTATRLGVLGAILWFIPGLIMAIGYVISGAVLCLTIIGIPFGIQAFQLALLALAPFGKKIVRTDEVGRSSMPAAAAP
ncbi:MAG: YccF domain-containing protein [Actinobacteria bacterium]|nr:YccF domain-containing protein [Actinomycetota bacterium]